MRWRWSWTRLPSRAWPIRENGQLKYLKTFRLSAAQTRWAFLLNQISQGDWHLDTAAQKLGVTRDDLVLRLEKAKSL